MLLTRNIASFGKSQSLFNALGRRSSTSGKNRLYFIDHLHIFRAKDDFRLLVTLGRAFSSVTPPNLNNANQEKDKKNANSIKKEENNNNSHNEYEEIEMRRHYVEKKKRDITLLGLGTNISLALAKLFIGYEMGSSALIADAVHSASDGVSDIVALGSLALSSQPPSAKQPFGYGHFDTLGSLILGLSLVVAGIGSGYFAMNELVSFPIHAHVATIKETSSQMNGVAGLSIVLSVLAKEWLFRVTYKLGKETRSNVLIANALHHRTDSLSSIVAGFGIVGSMMGLPLLDPVAALAVSGMVIKAGVEVAWDAVGDLTDRQTSEDHTEACAKIKQLAERLAESTEIVNTHDVRLRRMGAVRIVDLHVVVDPTLSVTASYHAGQRFRRAIMKELPDISEVFVHIDAGEHAFLPPPSESFEESFFHRNGEEQELPKSQYQIEAEVRRCILDVSRSQVPFLKGLSHINVHYVVQDKNEPAKAIVEVNLLVDSTKYDLKYSQLEEAGREVRRALLSRVDGLDSVDVHIQLGEGGEVGKDSFDDNEEEDEPSQEAQSNSNGKQQQSPPK